MGENENFIKFIGDRGHPAGREHWSITAKASLKFIGALPLDEILQKLRWAWKSFRCKHPSTASVASKDTLEYIVPDANTLQQWMNESLYVHSSTASLEDIIAHLRPSRFTTGHFLPATGEFALHFAHWRTDGFGALQLVNAFIAELSYAVGTGEGSIPWGEEAQRLVPSVEEVLDLPVTPTPEIEDAATRCLATLTHTKGAVGLALQADSYTPPRGTRSARLRLAQSVTVAISEACRARDISVLSAVHATCAMVTYAGAAADSKHMHYTSTMRFSLRPYLPDPYNTARFACGLYTGGYMSRVPASQSWLENARQYAEEYKIGVTPQFLRARRQYARKVYDMLSASPPPPNPPSSEVDISGVDNAEVLVSPVHHCRPGIAVEVEDVSIGVETLTRQMYCFVWTFRGHLELNLVYNEAYYEPAFASGLLEKLGRTLVAKLDLHGCGSLAEA